MNEVKAQPGRRSSVARNSVIMTLGFVLTSGFLFLNDLSVIEVFGPAVHGQVTLALSVAIFGAMLCDLGLASKAGVRTIAALRGRGSTGELGAAVGRLLVTLIVTGLLAAAAVNLASPVLAAWLAVEPFALRQASIWLFAGAGVRAAAMVFIGFERMLYVAVLGALAEGARFVWTLLCGLLLLDERYLYLGWSATWLASMLASMACVAVMGAGLGVRIAWWPYRLREAGREAVRGLAYLPPLLTNQALPPLMFLLVGLTLAWRGTPGDEANARLSVLKLCFSLALVLRIVSQAMATSLFPVVARQGVDTVSPHLRRTLGHTVRVLALGAVGALGGFIALGPWALAWWDARQGTALYAEGLPTLLLLTAAVAIDSYRVQVDQLLMGTRYVGVVVVGELVKTALLIVLIPLGAWWAAGAWTTEAGAACAVLVTVTVIAGCRGGVGPAGDGGGGRDGVAARRALGRAAGGGGHRDVVMVENPNRPAGAAIVSPRIVVIDGHTLNPGDLDFSPLAALGELVVHERTASADVLPRLEGAEAVLTNKVPFDAARFAALPALRYVGVTATGYNIIDTDAAAAHGVTVTNVPSYGTDSVAQHTAALMLELARHMAAHARAVDEGRWVHSADWCLPVAPVVELSGKTLGLIGCGAIGGAVAKIAAAMGMRIIAHTRSGQAQGDGFEIESVALDTLFAESDVISLHCPLTEQTRHVVDAARLEQIKPTAFLINTSRGPLIDRDALAAALRGERIAGAALDVLDDEPPPADDPLLGAPNCVITGHVAWWAREARQRLLDQTVSNLRAWLDGEPINVVG